MLSIILITVAEIFFRIIFLMISLVLQKIRFCSTSTCRALWFCQRILSKSWSTSESTPISGDVPESFSVVEESTTETSSVSCKCLRKCFRSSNAINMRLSSKLLLSSILYCNYHFFLFALVLGGSTEKIG
jgi:hypothetical protein